MINTFLENKESIKKIAHNMKRQARNRIRQYFADREKLQLELQQLRQRPLTQKDIDGNEQRY